MRTSHFLLLGAEGGGKGEQSGHQLRLMEDGGVK